MEITFPLIGRGCSVLVFCFFFFVCFLKCALMYVTKDMIWETAAQDNQKRSSVEIKEFSKKSSAVSLTECSLPQVMLMQTCSVLLCVHLEGEVRPCKSFDWVLLRFLFVGTLNCNISIDNFNTFAHFPR